MRLTKLDRHVIKALATLGQSRRWVSTRDLWQEVEDQWPVPRLLRPMGNFFSFWFSPSLGSLYLSLERLEDSELVRSRKVDASKLSPERRAARGGRGEMAWQLTAAGRTHL